MKYLYIKLANSRVNNRAKSQSFIHFLIRRLKIKQYGGKKEGEPEELTHLTEGSFEDTAIIVSFSENLSSETKKASLL